MLFVKSKTNYAIFSCLSVGWEPFLITSILEEVKKKAGIKFIHVLAGYASRIQIIQKTFSNLRCISLGMKKRQKLPKPNFTLLKKLEACGIPTIRSMIRGDPYLRHLPEDKSLGYATMVALRLKFILKKNRPDIVLASNDRMHSAMALAVAKSYKIPFVALAFTVLPDNLTGFLKALTPNQLVPIRRPTTNLLKREALTFMRKYQARQQKILAYSAPWSFKEYVSKYKDHLKSLISRLKNKEDHHDEFSAPPWNVSVTNIIRRTINRISLPSNAMLDIPPKKNYAYYPLHMAPESMVDTWAPFYQDQIAFVAQVALAIPIDLELVVKLHFSDPDNYSRKTLKNLMQIPGLRIAHPNASGRDFLEKAALVIGITGTSCLEAALLGKPVLIFGDSPYQHFPRTERARKPDELHKQIIQLLKKPKPSRPQLTQAYAKYLSRYMPGRINDWSRPFQKEEIEMLVNCFKELRKYLSKPKNLKEWYQQ